MAALRRPHRQGQDAPRAGLKTTATCSAGSPGTSGAGAAARQRPVRARTVLTRGWRTVAPVPTAGCLPGLGPGALNCKVCRAHDKAQLPGPNERTLSPPPCDQPVATCARPGTRTDLTFRWSPDHPFSVPARLGPGALNCKVCRAHDKAHSGIGRGAQL